MAEPSIPEVSTGQVIASSWGNTVRTKVQDTTNGHRHDGVGSRMLEGTKIKDVDATPVDDVLLKVLDAVLYLRDSSDTANRQIALACVPTMDDAHVPNVETLSYGEAFAVDQIPNLPASKITSERLTLSRMPAGALNYVLKAQGAGADPVYGQVAHGELTGVGASDHHTKTTSLADITDHNLTNHPLSIIPTMDDAHIPNLETLSYGGAFAEAQIPNLPASKITSEILAAARGGLAKALNPTWTNDYILVYKATADEWQMEAKGTPGAHKDTHVSGGSDAFVSSDLLDCISRIKVRKNSGASDVGSRRRFNFIEGSNVTLTVEDDATNEEVDITIASSGGGGGVPQDVHLVTFSGKDYQSHGDGAGTFDAGSWLSKLTSGEAINNFHWVTFVLNNWGGYPDFWSKDPQFEVTIRPASLTSVEYYILIGGKRDAPETASYKHFGVHIDGSSLKIVTSDGTTRSESSSLMTLTANQVYRIRCKLTSGTNVEVWVDKTSKGTKTTNLPSGNLSTGYAVPLFYVKTTEAVDKTLYLGSIIVTFDV